MTTFRDTAYEASSPRLRTSRAARLVYAFIGLPLDQIAQAAKDATQARFPTLAPLDALPALGRDRGLRRGPLEPQASYRARLLTWLAVWYGAGVGSVILDQIAAYLTPRQTRMRIWTQVGIIYTREADGTFTVSRATRGLWNWDGLTSLWARFWVIIDCVGGVPWSTDGTWDDGAVWDEDAGTWGSTATIGDADSIRAIIGDLKPAQSVCKNVIISFDASAFSPSDTSPPLPDGTWAHWSNNVGGTQTASRDSRAEYWDGIA